MVLEMHGCTALWRRGWKAVLLVAVLCAVGVSQVSSSTFHPRLRLHDVQHHVRLADEQDHIVATLDRLDNTTITIGCPEFLDAFYSANATSSAPFRSYTITKGPAYAHVVVHFARLWMPYGSTVLLRGVEQWTRQDQVVNLTDVFASGTLHEDIYTPPVTTRELRLEFYRSPSFAENSEKRCFGFFVDSYNYAMVNRKDDGLAIGPSNEEICLSDNTRPAICFHEDAASRKAFLASRAVIRLAIVREGLSTACTGWLLGSAGHIITNHHCVRTQTEAGATTVEFMADAYTCSEDCRSWGSCRGQVEAISTTLLHTSEEYDYSILWPHTSVDLPQEYGFLRLKSSRGRQGQAVYIPQHPRFQGKRIAMVDDLGNQVSLLSLTASFEGCAGTGYSYSGDTEGGSSGSPVLDATDHGVIALHHCGVFCANKGVPSVDIIEDLRRHNQLPPMATDVDGQPNTNFFPAYVPPPAPVPKPLVTRFVLNSAIQKFPNNQSFRADRIEFTIVEDSEIEFDVLSVEISDDFQFQDINMDCRASYMDPIMYLFPHDDSTVLMRSDDSQHDEGRGDGSISIRDPYARLKLRKGSYVLVISASPTNNEAALRGEVQYDYDPGIFSCISHGQYGPYRVTIASSSAVFVTKAPRNIPPLGCSLPAEFVCPLF